MIRPPPRFPLFPYPPLSRSRADRDFPDAPAVHPPPRRLLGGHEPRRRVYRDRKSTRLNSSHVRISYAVFCLKKKKTMIQAALYCPLPTALFSDSDCHSILAI